MLIRILFTLVAVKAQLRNALLNTIHAVLSKTLAGTVVKEVQFLQASSRVVTDPKSIEGADIKEEQPSHADLALVTLGIVINPKEVSPVQLRQA